MNTRRRYKGMSVNLLGLPIGGGQGVKNDLGRSLPKRIYHPSFVGGLGEKTQKNLLLIYDIPEGMKKERDWFRRQLRNLDFVMIQRSVWVGPSPLPKDFLNYVNEIGLKKDFKTFKLAKYYNLQSTL